MGMVRALCLIAALAVGAVAATAEAGSVGGKLLVANERMPDPRFQETVIYMVWHDEEGAFGLIVNKPQAAGPIGALLDQLGIDPGEDVDVETLGRSITVHYGGPVQPDRGFMLHSAEYGTSDTGRLSGWLALTETAEVLRDIARGRGPERSLLLFGYSGWGPAQLESELARGDWSVVPADPELVLGTDHESKWQRARRGDMII